MRIALTHAFCWPEVRRGAERFLAELGPALVRRGHEVTHFSSAHQPGATIERGVRTVRLPRRFEDQYRHEADFGRRLLPRLAGQRFDAVHSLGRHDALASIRAARLRGDGRRTVVTDLGLPDPVWWRQQGRRQARAAAKVVAGVDVYSAMSETAVDHLAANYGRRDGVVVPGGVDLASFQPAPAREPAPTILFSGAITEPRKGVAVLLRALPLIAEAEPGVTLWLSGPGDPTRAAGRRTARGAARERGCWASARPTGRPSATAVPGRPACRPPTTPSGWRCWSRWPVAPRWWRPPTPRRRNWWRRVSPASCARPRTSRGLAAACVRALALARDPATAGRCRRSAEPYDWDGGLAPLCEGLYRGLGIGFRG